MLNIRLFTLIAVYEERSVSKAALRLNLTQPAVSQHLKALEDELGGCKLFRRSENGMKATPEGEIAVQYARRFASLQAALERELKDFKRNRKQISIGVTNSTELSLISEILAKYCQLRPQMSIKIVEDSVQQLFQKMQDYQLDFVIVDGNVNSENCSSILLGTDYFVCILSSDNPLSSKKFVSTADLQKQKLILRTLYSGTREAFNEYLKSQQDNINNYNVILEMDNFNTIKDLVAQNVGVSVLPLSVCRRDMLANRIVGLPLENMTVKRDVNLVYLKDYENIELLSDIANQFNNLFGRK